MIKSIRYFLLFSLLLSITIASIINGIGNYLLDERVIQPYLDNQLARLTILIDVLNQSSKTNKEILHDINEYLKNTEPTLKQKTLFQVIGENEEVLFSSPNGAELFLKDAPVGFSDRIIHHQEWRIYTHQNPYTHIKVIVAELYHLRRELADDIAKNNATILLITYPIFALLVWFIISLALRSITRVTKEISNRASTFLEPVQLTEIPLEIKPLVGELNQLFIRLKLAFERNKRFAADAAHELRTPLAALKTHLQIALMCTNETDKKRAFDKVMQSVDRSSHVVAQLLTLSRLGEEEGLTDIKPLDLHKVAVEMLAYLAPQAIEKQIEIELDPPPKEGACIIGNEVAIGILIRNVVDNAIRYTPPRGEVKISILSTTKHVTFRVIDTGPGIPEELRDRVFERFYRILGTKAPGSGLGLAIVNQITSLHKGSLNLLTPKNGKGLQFEIAFPKYTA